jgi:hypothetical protein
MLPLAWLGGDLKSGASVADLILSMGLTDFSSIFSLISTCRKKKLRFECSFV